MTFEFDDFRLDRARRSLTLRGREVALQPKLFDLLCYLVQHRDRVVGKAELLDALWPEVVVSEGSLKRAISLVRSVLREGGARDAVRTHPRKGYRFCLDVLERERSDAPGAAVAAAAQEGQGAEAAAELERAGKQAQRAGRSGEATEALGRALALYASRRDAAGAARCALQLSLLHFEQGELTVGRGWLRRGGRYLPEAGELPEHGFHAWLSSRYATADGDIPGALELAERAHAIGRRLDDPNLEALGLLYKGMALVAQGEVDRGCAHHDEAAATVLSAETDPFVGGLVYCGLIYTCRNRADWRRASEWTERFTQLCERTGIVGTCPLHRAQLLQVEGSLSNAQAEAERVCAELEVAAPWALGDGYALLGDLHLARGDLEQAEEAYRRAHERGWEPQPGLARLMILRGRAKAAMLSLQRALQSESWQLRQRRALLLSQLVHAALSAGEPGVAQQARQELLRSPELWRTPALRAAVAEACAALARHAGDSGAAARSLRRAREAYGEAHSKLDQARVRLELAALLLSERDADGAEFELAAAERALAGSDAAPLLSRLRALRDSIV